jgi:phage FluMu protein Com
MNSPEGKYIIFHCEHCHQKMKMPEVHAGKRARCPKCKDVITIPHSEAEFSVPASPLQNQPEPMNDSVHSSGVFNTFMLCLKHDLRVLFAEGDRLSLSAFILLCYLNVILVIPAIFIDLILSLILKGW